MLALLVVWVTLVAGVVPSVASQALGPPGQETATLLVGAAAAPVVATLVEVLVKPFLKDGRWYPIAALVFGILLNLLGQYAAYDITAPGPPPMGRWLLTAVILGLTSGYAGSGIWSHLQTGKADQAAGP